MIREPDAQLTDDQNETRHYFTVLRSARGADPLSQAVSDVIDELEVIAVHTGREFMRRAARTAIDTFEAMRAKSQASA